MRLNSCMLARGHQSFSCRRSTLEAAVRPGRAPGRGGAVGNSASCPVGLAEYVHQHRHEAAPDALGEAPTRFVLNFGQYLRFTVGFRPMWNNPDAPGSEHLLIGGQLPRTPGSRQPLQGIDLRLSRRSGQASLLYPTPSQTLSGSAYGHRCRRKFPRLRATGCWRRTRGPPASP